MEEWSYANSIVANGKDIYIAGYEVGDKTVALYWKNGEAVFLTDGQYNAEANSIFVSDGDVYVAGYEDNGEYKVAKYWKNGEAVCLSDGTGNAGAHAIVVVDNVVHIVGGEYYKGKSVAQYWRNGVVVPQTDCTKAVANSIAIAGNDVYICGNINNGVEEVGASWVNGIKKRPY